MSVTIAPYDAGRLAGLRNEPAELPVSMAHLDLLSTAARAWCRGHAAGVAERESWAALADERELGCPVG